VHPSNYCYTNAFKKLEVPYVAKNSRYCMYTFTEIDNIFKKEKHAVRPSPEKKHICIYFFL
jgi:hypothetical protein